MKVIYLTLKTNYFTTNKDMEAYKITIYKRYMMYK